MRWSRLLVGRASGIYAVSADTLHQGLCSTCAIQDPSTAMQHMIEDNIRFRDRLRVEGRARGRQAMLDYCRLNMHGQSRCRSSRTYLGIFPRIEPGFCRRDRVAFHTQLWGQKMRMRAETGIRVKTPSQVTYKMQRATTIKISVEHRRLRENP